MLEPGTLGVRCWEYVEEHSAVRIDGTWFQARSVMCGDPEAEQEW